MHYRLFILLLSFSTVPFCQDDDDVLKERRFFAGINVGTKLANKTYAHRYAGWYQNELENALLNNTNTYNEIKYNSLGGFDFYLPFDYYPQKPRYSPGILTGLMLGFKLAPELQASVDVNFCRLKMRDVFSVVVDDPGNQTSQELYELGEIYAAESRFNARFNFDYVNPGEIVNFIMGLNGQFGAWRIEEQVYMFQGYTMPVFSVHNPTNGITKKVTGLGWGAGINLGLEYRFNEQIVTQLMYQPHHSQFDFDTGIIKRFRLEHDIVLRILWK